MKKLAAKRSVKITAIVLSIISFLVLASSLVGIIKLADFGAYTNSFETIRDSYINNINNALKSPESFNNVIAQYNKTRTLDDYSLETGNLYTISVGKTVLYSNFDDNDNNYTAITRGGYQLFNKNTGEPTFDNVEVTIYYPKSIFNLGLLETGYSIRYTLILLSVIALTITAMAIVILQLGVGYSQNSDAVTLRRLDKIPFNRHTTYLFAFALFQLFLYTLLKCIYDGITKFQLITYFILITADYLLILNWLTSLTILSRSKQMTRRSFFVDNIKNLFISIGAGLKHLPLIWKTIIILLGWNIFEFWLILTYNRDLVTLITTFLVSKAITIPFIIAIALILQKFKNAGKNIADGDLNYRLYTSSMWGEFAEFGETLNNISYGMNKALNDRMKSEIKSERFKTELITNVSHDIKTPLTSIINYVDLIKKEKPENENVNQYINVLDRQSSRLKKLLEDLIEASKALSGNIKVELVPCELNVLLSQIIGEYDELLAKKSLELVVTPPEYDINVMADVRHLWRVIDNLMTNIYKYSQENTRVYISLSSPIYDRNHAYLIFKNVSKAPLNISSDELMERFTRSDSSRNTEGSGLGLSIAKSLVELQGGVFTLDIDGDLFKATLRFDVINISAEENDDEQ